MVAPRDGERETCLLGQRAAFTGRLAYLTWAEFERLVRCHGGEPVRRITADTTLLVLGQHGWPLDRRGRLTRRLIRARKLLRQGAAIEIVPEESFLERIGLPVHRHDEPRLYTAAELRRLIPAARRGLSRWIAAGLIRPIKTVHAVRYFDFAQVSAVRHLCELAGRGVDLRRVRRSLRRLGVWLDDAHGALTQLALLEESGRLVARTRQGHLIEPSGQMQLEFSASEPSPSLALRARRRRADAWFETAWRFEQHGDLARAAQAYRRVLLLEGPSADVCFNLANVLYALDQTSEALDQFRQAVEADPTLAAAWNNLGAVLAEQGQAEAAIEAYRQALAVDPASSDAHYNLAELLEDLGHRQEAAEHWQAYLAIDADSPWADYATDCLRAGKTTE